MTDPSAPKPDPLRYPAQQLKYVVRSGVRYAVRPDGWWQRADAENKTEWTVPPLPPKAKPKLAPKKADPIVEDDVEKVELRFFPGSGLGVRVMFPVEPTIADVERLLAVARLSEIASK